MKPYTTQKFTLTLTIPIEVSSIGEPVDIDTNVVERVLSKDNYSDGRYPFEEEMFRHGLTEMLSRGVFQAILTKCEKQFGPHKKLRSRDGRTCINKPYYFAEKTLRRCRVWVEQVTGAKIVIDTTKE